MQNIREQNPHEGLFLFNVPGGGGGGLWNIKAQARSVNEVNLAKPGRFAPSAPESTLIMATASKETVPGVWARLHWETELHLYIQANSTALLRAESILEK